MDIKNTFEVAQKMADLAVKYEQLFETTNNKELKISLIEFIDKLDEYHSRLLKLGTFSTGDEIDKIAVNTTSVGDLPSYCQLYVIYEYPEENLALVESLGNSLHLVPLDKLRYEE